MDKILEFFKKNRVFFLFILLEVVSFVIMINKNDFQQSVQSRRITNFVAKIYDTTSKVDNYFGLYKVNEDLAAENTELRNRLSLAEEKLDKLYADSLIAVPEILNPDNYYIGARVVYNSLNNQQNYIIIDRGSKDGVEADMGVISSRGVVGVVLRTSENYSVIISLLNTSQRISAKIKRNNQLGSIVWNGVSASRIQMEEVPLHVNPVAGDTIVTSGYSLIFPEGMIVGYVNEAFADKSEQFCHITVDLAVDFNSIDYVMVTNFSSKKELLEQQKSLDADEK